MIKARTRPDLGLVYGRRGGLIAGEGGFIGPRRLVLEQAQPKRRLQIRELSTVAEITEDKTSPDPLCALP